MKALIDHLGFIAVIAAAVVVVVMCEYARRKIKTKPNTLGWYVLSVLVYVVYALLVVFVVFNVITELFV